MAERPKLNPAVLHLPSAARRLQRRRRCRLRLERRCRLQRCRRLRRFLLLRCLQPPALRRDLALRPPPPGVACPEHAREERYRGGVPQHLS